MVEMSVAPGLATVAGSSVAPSLLIAMLSLSITDSTVRKVSFRYHDKKYVSVWPL